MIMNAENLTLNDAYEFLLKQLKDKHIFLMDVSESADTGSDEALQEKTSSNLEISAKHLANIDDLTTWLKNKS